MFNIWDPIIGVPIIGYFFNGYLHTWIFMVMQLKVDWQAALGVLLSTAVFFSSEMASQAKCHINFSCRRPLIHDWYDWNHPGAALVGARSMGEQTALAILNSVHLHALPHLSSIKFYPLAWSAIWVMPQLLTPCDLYRILDTRRVSCTAPMMQFFIFWKMNS